MKKGIQILVFAIFSNCVFAQNGYLDMRYSDMRQKDNPSIGFINHSKLQHNPRLTTKNKLLKSDKSLKWQWDTIIVYDTLSNDTIGQLWRRFTQTFDSHGNIITNKEEEWQNDIWVNSYLYNYTYDSRGNILTDIQEIWFNNKWELDNKDTCIYYTNGNLRIYLSELWYNNKWENDSRSIYTYDLKENKLAELIENWMYNIWVNNDSTSYSYDTNGNLLNFILEFWQNNAWVNASITSYTYDSNGNMLTFEYEYWQNNVLIKSDSSLYSYDANKNLLTILVDYWKNNHWIIGSSREIFSYDMNGNRIIDLSETWQNNTWLNIGRFTYTYDANGNSLTGKCEFWNKNSWQPYTQSTFGLYSQKNPILFTSEGIYRYQANWISFPQGINQLTNKNEQLTIYPNPVNEVVTIDFTGYAGRDKLSVEVYSITGELLKQSIFDCKQSTDNKFQLNISDLAEGVYVIKITDDNGVTVKKIIKE